LAKAAITESVAQDADNEVWEAGFLEADNTMSVKSIWRFFSFTESQRKKLPSREDAVAGAVQQSGSAWSTLVQSVLTAATAVAEVLYPGGAQQLLESVAYKILGKQRPEVELERAAERIAKVVMAAPRNTVQKRVSRACLVKGFSKAVLAKLCKSDRLTLSGTSEQQSYRDYNRLEEGQVLEKPRGRAVRFNEEHARKAVKFILHTSNVGALSWGSRPFRLSENESVTLPILVRRVSVKEMFERYCESVEVEEQIKRSSFYTIVKAITHSDEKLLTAVDYVTGVLVNDQVSTLQDMIEAFACTPSRKEELTSQLELVRNFLKAQVGAHVCRENDSVPTHGLEYGLSQPIEGELERAGKCNACDFIPYFIQRMRGEISSSDRDEPKAADSVQDALRVLDDVEHKFVLYQGHRVRVANQQSAIACIYNELEQECLQENRTTRAVMTIDWKMKFESMSARETTQQHFGKRGISWHGCLLSYFRPKTVADLDANGEACVKTVAERVNVYVDQILDGDNKQDTFAVASMVEAVLQHVHGLLPNISSIILQSDNAKCYNSNPLRVLVALINSRSPLKVERHVFTETQDGKGLIDAHFARAMAHVLKFMRTSQRNRIRAIATPNGLAYALAWGGGVTNSCVQLVRVDRAKLQALAEHVNKCAGSLSKVFSRCNDISYSHLDRPMVQLSDIQAAREESVAFTIAVRAYSNVGRASRFSVTVGGGARFLPREDDPAEQAPENDEEDDREEPDVSGEHDDQPLPVQDFIVNSEDPADGLVVDEGGRRADDNSNQEEVESNGEDAEEEEEDLEDVTMAPENIQYSTVADSSGSMLTGVVVLKQSGFITIVGPRTSSCKRKRLVHKEDGRKDVEAFAVRHAADLFDAQDVQVRDGRADMPEYELAAGIATLPRPRGWARRPRHGHQYGATYMSMYEEEIRRLFERGAETSSEKVGPAQMLEILKQRHPGRFSLPSESEIRSQISKLFAQAKKRKATSFGAHSASGAAPRPQGPGRANPSGRRGRPSKIPANVLDFIEAVHHEKPSSKASEALVRVRNEFGKSIQDTEGGTVTDNQIKAKFNNVKQAAQRQHQAQTAGL
jgi:hypothetical protein